VLQAVENDKLRMFYRMFENFSGCRVLTYCLMCNHKQIPVEMTPGSMGGLSDEALLGRMQAIYHEAFVAELAKEPTEARKLVAAGQGAESVLVGRIHK
jgi:hypothetical protein